MYEQGVPIEMFSIRDTKAGAFLQPFFSTNVETALRAVSDHLDDQNNPITKHADDYCLFRVGVFDQGSGALVALPAPESIAVLSTLRRQPLNELYVDLRQAALEEEHPEWCFKEGCDCENSIMAREGRLEVESA